MICPTCQKTVDPIRAPAAKIIGGRVMTFCSPECARGGAAVVPVPVPVPVPVVESAPTAVPAPVVIEASAPAVAAEPLAATPPPTPTAVVRSLTDDATAPEPRSRKRVWAAALGMLIAAGIGGALVQTVSPGRSTPAAAADAVPPPAPIAAPAPVAPEPPARPTKEAMLAKAHATLEGFLADSSPRLRREAAMALARTQEPAALAELVKQLDSEPSEVIKVAIADALARARRARGREFLVAALANTRRDIRMNAAIALAHMGDDKAVSPLKGWLTLSTHKLSAAGSLALLHQPEGIAVLKDALVAREAEPRMRAAAALGLAGDATGKPLLLEMIADPRYDQLAALALARLGEKAAEPVLTRVLVLSSLSVEAAIGLRRLGTDVDLSPLASVLEHGDEVARIEAAEAVIVLCDPKPPTELH